MRHVPRTIRARSTGTLLSGILAGGLVLTMAATAQAAPTAVGLGTADSFVVLAGAGITNTGPTTLNGDIGTFPTTSISGAASLIITGTNHGGDAVTQGAKPDLVTGYNNAAGQGPPSPISSDLGGRTLTSGVYNSASSMGLTGTLTLNAQGDPDAVFVFQAGSTLTTASASRVRLTNGAQACNVFWQVGSSATLGTASTFRGTILALTDITLTTAATVEGRVLARNGAVTLDTNTITRPACVTEPDDDDTGSGGPGTGGTGSGGPGSGGPGTGGSGSGGSGDDGGSGGSGGGSGSGTGDQISVPPSGGVDTGSSASGSSASAPGELWLAVFLLGGVGGLAVVAGRRRLGA